MKIRKTLDSLRTSRRSVKISTICEQSFLGTSFFLFGEYPVMSTGGTQDTCKGVTCAPLECVPPFGYKSPEDMGTCCPLCWTEFAYTYSQDRPELKVRTLERSSARALERLSARALERSRLHAQALELERVSTPTLKRSSARALERSSTRALEPSSTRALERSSAQALKPSSLSAQTWPRMNHTPLRFSLDI